jgi:TPR repeat protein
VPKDINHARDLYQKAAMAGDDCGQNNYGHILAQQKKYDEAMAWFRLSAAQEYGMAYANIAWMYENAFGVPRNLDSAVWYARKARNMGVSAGQFRMGWLFEKGWGLPQSYDSALYLYKLAAQDNYGAAECNLGVMYAKGRKVPHNDTTAVSLYRRAIVHNSVRAKNNIGWMHENGFGLPRNCDSAIVLYREAAAAEDTFAIANLKRIERDGCLQGTARNMQTTETSTTKTVVASPRLMKVYPNPNSGHFTIELPADVTEPARIELYDMQGAVVYQTASNHAGKTLYVDVAPGMYVLRVMTNAEKWTERVQINR